MTLVAIDSLGAQVSQITNPREEVSAIDRVKKINRLFVQASSLLRLSSQEIEKRCLSKHIVKLIQAKKSYEREFVPQVLRNLRRSDQMQVIGEIAFLKLGLEYSMKTSKSLVRDMRVWLNRAESLNQDISSLNIKIKDSFQIEVNEVIKYIQRELLELVQEHEEIFQTGNYSKEKLQVLKDEVSQLLGSIGTRGPSFSEVEQKAYQLIEDIKWKMYVQPLEVEFAEAVTETDDDVFLIDVKNIYKKSSSLVRRGIRGASELRDRAERALLDSLEQKFEGVIVEANDESSMGELKDIYSQANQLANVEVEGASKLRDRAKRALSDLEILQGLFPCFEKMQHSLEQCTQEDFEYAKDQLSKVRCFPQTLSKVQALVDQCQKLSEVIGDPGAIQSLWAQLALDAKTTRSVISYLQKMTYSLEECTQEDFEYVKRQLSNIKYFPGTIEKVRAFINQCQRPSTRQLEIQKSWIELESEVVEVLANNSYYIAPILMDYFQRSFSDQ